MAKGNKPVKPLHPVAKPATQEEKERQVAIYLANEKKTYFQLILANLLQNPNAVRETQITVKGTDGIARAQLNILDIVDAAIDGADYAIERLFPLPKAEDAK